VQDLKISLITVAYNAEDTILNCIESVISQNYSNIEYIFIDGGSTDKTLSIAENYRYFMKYLISEPDGGIYDAMNKGIGLASGQIIGTLNADDFFAAADVLPSIAGIFKNYPADVVYGDLDYVTRDGRIVRKWRSGTYAYGMFNRGWMPPHPTFYCRRELFLELGCYNLQYGTAADYELMLRFMHRSGMDVRYLNKVLVSMTAGGVSNKSFRNRINAWQCDFRAMKANGIAFPILALVLKPMRKIFQYRSTGS
jgi:glycosyltransferase involved in cell wall biosynthesis